MRFFIGVIILLCFCACTAQDMGRSAPIDGQERVYAVPADMVFEATLQALKAADYLIIHSDKSTGFISAKSPTTTQSQYSPLSGFKQAFHTLSITSHIKSTGDSSHIEIRFLSINQDSGLYGTARHYAPVQNDRLYDDIFGKIEVKLPNKPVL